jgi:hypothetical protein
LNKKVQIAMVALLATAMVAISLMGTVEACGWGRGWWWHRSRCYTYKADVTLGLPVVTYVNASGAPFKIIIEGYRPATSVIECVITINGVEYSYPDDFDYEEVFHMESNGITGDANGTGTTTLTFINLPGKPSISEHMTSTASGGVYDGTFVLSGTKMFHKVSGGGSDTAHYEGEGADEVLVISRTGVIKGWPFWLR